MINLNLRVNIYQLFGDVPMNSFGHFGYTGTYAWADPDKEIIIVILANRTYPNDNFSFSENNVRTRIQEIVYNRLLIKR